MSVVGIPGAAINSKINKLTPVDQQLVVKEINLYKFILLFIVTYLCASFTSDRVEIRRRSEYI